MARQPDEQHIRSRARRRLIGAIALALAVVVILPMVLDSEPRITGKDIELRIPAPDKAGEFVPGVAISEVVEAEPQAESAVGVANVTEVPPASGAAVETTVRTQNGPAVAGQVVKAVPPAPVETKKPIEIKQLDVKNSERIAVKPEIKTENKPEAKSETRAEPKQDSRSTGNHVVQVGAFSNSATATQEADKLKAWGFKAYTEVISGTTRVRVGPYADRSKAEEVRQMLEKHGLHPVVTVVKP